jgi:hypothetical protein
MEKKQEGGIGEGGIRGGGIGKGEIAEGGLEGLCFSLPCETLTVDYKEPPAIALLN